MAVCHPRFAQKKCRNGAKLTSNTSVPLFRVCSSIRIAVRHRCQFAHTEELQILLQDQNQSKFDLQNQPFLTKMWLHAIELRIALEFPGVRNMLASCANGADIKEWPLLPWDTGKQILFECQNTTWTRCRIQTFMLKCQPQRPWPFDRSCWRFSAAGEPVWHHKKNNSDTFATNVGHATTA